MGDILIDIRKERLRDRSLLGIEEGMWCQRSALSAGLNRKPDIRWRTLGSRRPDSKQRDGRPRNTRAAAIRRATESAQGRRQPWSISSASEAVERTKPDSPMLLHAWTKPWRVIGVSSSHPQRDTAHARNFISFGLARSARRRSR